MSALLSPAVGRILCAPWQQRRNESGWSWVLLLVLFGVLPVAAGKGAGAAVLVAVGVSLVAVVSLILWWMVLLNLAQQNHPTLARLLPGQVVHLRRVFIGLAVAISLCVAALAGAFIGHAAWIAIGVGALLLFVALSVRWPWAWVALAFGPMLLTPVLRYVHPQIDPRPLVAAVHSPFFLPVLAALELGWAVLLSRQFLMEGGEAHVRLHARLQRWAVSMQAQMRGDLQAKRAQLPLWLQRWLQQPYSEWFARRIALRNAQPGDAMSRAWLAVGPVAHWTGQAATAVTLSVALLLFLAFTWVTRPPGRELELSAAGWGPMVGLFIFALVASLQAHANFHARRRELALLSLVPGLPRGGDFNRRLARAQGVQAMTGWALATTLLPLLFGWLHGDPRVPVAFAFGCLPFVTWGWKDWSRVPAANSWNSMGPTLLCLGCGLLGWASYQWAGLHLAVVMAAGLSVAVGWGGWRWKRLSRAPQAWPVGRLAG
jgi:hypothetical protein